jgi:hypothetical protein
MLSNPAKARRTAAGLALIAAPLLFLVADVISPAWSDDTAEYVREVAESPDAQAWSGLLYVIGFALIVPAVIGIVHLIRGRGVALAHIGGALAILGLGMFPALAVTSILDAVAVESISQGDYVAVIDGFEDEAAAIVLLILTLVPALLSLLLIAAAVWRSGLAPWPVAAVLVLSALLLVVATSQALNVASDALLLIGFGFLGVRLLQMADSDWEHPPLQWGRSLPPAQTGDDRA